MEQHEASPASCALLDTNGKEIEAQSIEVGVSIEDFIAQIDLSYQYFNASENPIETTFYFGLSAKTTVCSFKAIIDQREIVGIVKEKEKAFETYDEAISEGKGACLIERHSSSPDILKVSIGNLPPNKRAIIKVGCTTELVMKSDRAQFLLPTCISQRYSSEPKENSPTPTQYGLNIRVKYSLLSDARNVICMNHQASVTQSDKRNGVITYQNASAALGKDFVLEFHLECPNQTRLLVEKFGTSTAAGLSLYPQLESEEGETPCDIVFVVDRSSSMAPCFIQVRKVLDLFMHSLPEDCMFNIVSFGSRFSMLFDKSQAYNEEALKTAKEHIATMNANMNGTEIREPLKAVLSSPMNPKYPRQLILLTDGEVQDVDSIIELVKTQGGMTRIFTIGVGDRVSHALVEGVARVGRGTCEFISSHEDIVDKTLKQLTNALSASIRDVRIDWGITSKGMESPCVLPPMYKGDQFLVYCIWEDQLPELSAKNIKVTALGPNGLLTFTVDERSVRYSEGNLLHRLAARALIRDLEEGTSWLHRATPESSATQIEQQCVQLGTKYNLASKFTSFVAVEDRQTPVYTTMEIAPTPKPQPKNSWKFLQKYYHQGAFFSAADSTPISTDGAPTGLPTILKRQRSEESGVNENQLLVPKEAFRQLSYQFHRRGGKRQRKLKQKYVVSDKKVDKAEEISDTEILLGLQKAKGCWELTSSFLLLFSNGQSFLDLGNKFFGHSMLEEEKAIWATAIAIQTLQSQQKFNLVCLKGRRWMTKALQSVDNCEKSVDEVLQAVVSCIVVD